MAFLLSSSSPLLALAPINSVVIKLIGERGPMLGHVRLLLPIYTSYTGGTVRKVHKITYNSSIDDFGPVHVPD